MRRIILLVLVGLLSLTQINCGKKSSPSAPGSDSAYSFITNIGFSGNPESPYQFSEITGVAVSGDKLFVGDADDWDIEVYDLQGNYITYFWPYDNSASETLPVGLATDKFGHLYVADPDNEEVDTFNVSSIPLTATGQSVYAIQTYGAGCAPVGIAVDKDGLIYVADPCESAIYSIVQTGINSGSGNGTDSGSASINGGFLAEPIGIAVSPDGSKIYATDEIENVVQVYDSNFNWLKVIGDAAGAADTVTGKFDSPEGLAIDNSGNLLVADTDNARIQKFSAGGSYLASFGNTATNISNGQLYSPWAITVDAANEVFVTDTNYETVFKFASN